MIVYDVENIVMLTMNLFKKGFYNNNLIND